MPKLDLSYFQPMPGFSCVKMKRELQERIYRETEGMTGEEVREYIRQRAERVRKDKEEYQNNDTVHFSQGAAGV